MSTLSRLTALKSGAGARRIRVRASRWFASATYGHKWLLLGTIIGIIAGLGAVVFYETVEARYALVARRARRLPEPHTIR